MMIIMQTADKPKPATPIPVKAMTINEKKMNKPTVHFRKLLYIVGNLAARLPC